MVVGLVMMSKTIFWGWKMQRFLKNLANHTDQDDVLFGNQKWLDNFKEMKQAAIDPLYKDCSKHWLALHFNLQLHAEVLPWVY